MPGSINGESNTAPILPPSRSGDAGRLTRARQALLPAAGRRRVIARTVRLIERDDEQAILLERGRAHDQWHPLLQKCVDRLKAAQAAVNAFRIVPVVTEIGSDE